MTREPGLFRTAPASGVVEARDLSEDRWLRGMEENPRREDAARADHRCREGFRPARSRRRGLSDGREVELHAAQRTDAEVRGVQLGRKRTRHLPRSRHSALQPAFAHRGHGDRRLRMGATVGYNYIRGDFLAEPVPRSKPRSRKRTQRVCSARTSRAPGSILISTPSSARAPTSAARRPHCSIRSKASKASRASSRHSRLHLASTARPPPSTTLRATPRCRRSCARVRSGSPRLVLRVPVAP